VTLYPTLRRSIAACGIVAALAGCGADDTGGNRTTAAAPAPSGDPGPVHVHGLGENPKDGALFVATHTGLFRIATAGDAPKRIADRYQDTMGFTVIGPDRFLGSGHPDGRDGLPPFLGLIESTDAGESWSARSLEGKADFHVLEAADDVVYGYGADWDTREAQFLVSRDRGRTWSRRVVPEPLVSLAIHPADPARFVAAGERGLHASAAGEGWRPVDGPTGLLSWPTPDRLYSIDEGGIVRVSDNEGRTWRVAGDAVGEPAAFEATGRDELYVALHDGQIRRSTDGGRRWRDHWSP
jgi:hypothetical protein